MSEVHHLLKILPLKLTRFLADSRQCALFRRSKTSWEVSKWTSCRRVPNAGEPAGSLAPLLLSLVASELRILGWLICHRMDAGSRNNWVCAAHPSFQPTSFQPFCQLFIGPEISPDGKNQLSHMQQTLLSERLWPCDEDDKVSHRPFMKLIENNLYSQLTVWFASSNHGLFWRRNHFFL